jgi:hypothetical protein
VITLARLAPEDEAAVRAFNARLAAGAAGFQFPASLREFPVPTAPGPPVWTEVWIARDGESVRGGFLLKHERLLLPAGTQAVGNFQLPLSEGIIDRRYATVGVSLPQRALALEPALYALGMGSVTRPLPRLLARLKWTVEEVPFFFRVVHGGAFVRNVRALRTSPRRRVILDVLGASGLAGFGALTWGAAARARALAQRHRVRLRAVPQFDERADRVLEACRGGHAALLDRGSVALNIKFPADDTRLRRYIVEASGRASGWLLLTVSDLKDHKQFGDLRLGCLVDGLAEPHLIGPAVAAAARELTAAGVDLIVSNQSHAGWQHALEQALFVRGPSNFVLARSPAFVPHLPLASLHFNRGDGDGPINL